MSKLPSYKVPFDSNGNLRSYSVGLSATLWRENLPFEKTLIVDGMYSGRSAKGMIWRDEEGHKYPMFTIDLLEVLKSTQIARGRVTAKWIVRKRGQNYGIVLFEE